MAEAVNSNDDPKRLEISKYPNRRYYDKTRSKHLTLEEIYAAIRSGYEVEVTDSKTGEDITGKILAQIILELDPPKLDVFPVALLHKILRANEQLVTEFTQKYFSQALMTFLDSQKKTEQYMRQAMGLYAAPTPLTDLAKLMLGPFAPPGWVAPTQPSKEQSKDTSKDTGAPTAETLQRIERLQKEIVQLHERLARAEKKKPARKARRGK